MPTRVLGEAILLELRALNIPVMINFVVTEEISSLVWRKANKTTADSRNIYLFICIVG